ncbi:MAG TPA: class I SAM-dependent methyltransferase [Pseudonocardiaceae bacterium]|jgi:SAM-dependent methyltransferase|nr:class I SAM-dependent methyltransferase [Pseudonocardiaceae bacterium]
MTDSGSAGSGPGVITDDGSAVELYRRLPAGTEPALIHAALPAGASILELGSGAGRITRPLLALGHPVVAVDRSAAMLAEIRDTRTVLADIEDLRLPERFDAVLFASHLVNEPEHDSRLAMLRTCRHHLRPEGSALIEWHPPAWFDALPAEVTDDEPERIVEGVGYRWREIRRPSGDLLTASIEYRLDADRWTRSFSVRKLIETDLRTYLAHAGLSFAGYLDAEQTWLRAVVPEAERNR